ncbi:Ldh family oxidoreductase [Halomonas sp. M20]|uniref:Ldh family oxidoreductase n=1 Tax=Halomonas sp. M20 TaxID=2763264 RepID=UPI001D0A0814|nr:Ldh family oxidoreductase [Halomonas sp. M20]
MADKTVFLSEEDALTMSRNILLKKGFSKDVSRGLSETVVAGQKDGCGSHGLYRILGCIKTLEAGGVVPDAEPHVEDASGSIVRINANGGFSQLSFSLGLPLLIEKAKENGIALLAINHCVHFSALWIEVEQITRQGLVAIACNPTQAYVAPHGGSAPLLGTNPFAFGWPRPGKPPFVFDFATSTVARGDVELYEREGKPIPDGWGVDSKGQGCNDPRTVLEKGALLTFGEHKGAALSMMIELIAGPLIGDLMSYESSQHDKSKGALPYHGEVIIAMDPAMTAGRNFEEHLARAETLFDSVESQGARLPSGRRYKNREKSEKDGIEISEKLYLELRSLLDE